MRCVVVTKWFSGLGLAMRLRDEGYEVELAVAGIDDQRLQARHARVGDGLVAKRTLADMMADRARRRDAYFVWDENHSVDENECLRREGFKVLGGGAYADAMEHDRDACLEFVGRYGLQSPPSHSFDDAEAAIRFLVEHATTAYVFKPDVGDNHETFLPHSERAEDANLELRAHLRSLRSRSPFVPQERKDGVETAVEVWFVQGQPRFAFMTLEAKRRLTGDLGDLAAARSTSPSPYRSNRAPSPKPSAGSTRRIARCATPASATPMSSSRGSTAFRPSSACVTPRRGCGAAIACVSMAQPASSPCLRSETNSRIPASERL